MANKYGARMGILVGHWEKDSGAVDPVSAAEADALDTKEVELNRQLSLVLCQVLASCGASVKLFGGSLKQRCLDANEFGPALCISVHCNAGPPAARGTETLWSALSKRPNESKKLATLLDLWTSSTGGTLSRGVKQRDNLYELKNVESPIALVEVGFITNPQEEAMLWDHGFQRDWALGAAIGAGRFLARSA